VIAAPVLVQTALSLPALIFAEILLLEAVILPFWKRS